MNYCCFDAMASFLKKRDKSENQKGTSIAANTRNFSLNELRAATDNFHLKNKIGRGGFGTVYKGFLKNGKRVAVKTLSAESKQGEHEFLTEIDIISNVKHPNLVELIGSCVNGVNRILVYEYLENSSIDRVLFGLTKKTIKLNWEKRSNICMGTARGLAYLHEELVPHIVHRDIKASNILLDDDFRPKIGDFGLAKLFPEDITHISTKIAGTSGYLAPEYALGGPLTLKADVYSFGVLVLEIISGKSSGQSNYSGIEKFIVLQAWELHEEGRLLDLVDTEMEEYPETEVLRYMKVALFCTQANASRRPLMSTVIEMLSKNVRLNVNQLMSPGFFDPVIGRTETSRSHQISSLPITITQITPR